MEKTARKGTGDKNKKTNTHKKKQQHTHTHNNIKQNISQKIVGLPNHLDFSTKYTYSWNGEQINKVCQVDGVYRRYDDGGSEKAAAFALSYCHRNGGKSEGIINAVFIRFQYVRANGQ